jgi:peptidoglycan/xylan/chitin deacetylase (PgdA/CDA1 family)
VNAESKRSPLVVAYHAVSSRWRSSLAVPELVLRSQLALLRSRGYVGLMAVEAERRRREGTLPDRSLVVTFDDGFRSVLRAKPILDELGYPGTVFVVTQFVESGEPLSWPGLDQHTHPVDDDELRPLTWDQLAELRAAGWEVGSHTCTHRLSTDLTDANLDAEFGASRTLLERRLGDAETLAYPYGRADHRVAAAAERAGYVAAFTLETVRRTDEPHRRPRLDLSGRDGPLRLALRISAGANLLLRSRGAHELSRRRRSKSARASWLPPQTADDSPPPA